MRESWLERVEIIDTCWIWQGAKTRAVNGYGRVRTSGGMKLAHREFYEHYIGPIPSGLQIDHICNKPLCVNPNHLETVTRSENQKRSVHRDKTHVNGRKTHCKNGHEFSPENTTIAKGNGQRRCNQCCRDSSMRYHWANREECLERMSEYGKTRNRR